MMSLPTSPAPRLNLVVVLGALHASPAVKAALADRIR
jgi:hypothetical protein